MWTEIPLTFLITSNRACYLNMRISDKAVLNIQLHSKHFNETTFRMHVNLFYLAIPDHKLVHLSTRTSPISILGLVIAYKVKLSNSNNDLSNQIFSHSLRAKSCHKMFVACSRTGLLIAFLDYE